MNTARAKPTPATGVAGLVSPRLNQPCERRRRPFDRLEQWDYGVVRWVRVQIRDRVRVSSGEFGLGQGQGYGQGEGEGEGEG